MYSIRVPGRAPNVVLVAVRCAGASLASRARARAHGAGSGWLPAHAHLLRAPPPAAPPAAAARAYPRAAPSAAACVRPAPGSPDARARRPRSMGSRGQRRSVRRTQRSEVRRGAAGEQHFDGGALRRAAGRAARAAGFGFDAAALLRGVFRVEPGGPSAPDGFRELAA